VVVHERDSGFAVIDIDSGQLVTELADVTLSRSDEPFLRMVATGGNLLIVEKTAVTRLPLNGGEASRMPFSGIENTIGMPTPCGGGLLCLLVGDARGARLHVLNIVTGRELWRQPVSVLSETISPGESHVLVSGGAESYLFDLEGNDVAPQIRKSYAKWFDQDHLLMFQQDGIQGISLSTGEQVMLREGGVPGYCDNNSTMFVCPAREGVFVHRYPIR
jgi:hypothetical protein